MAGIEITPPRDGAAIGYLQDPELSRCFGTVKGSAEPMNQYEDVLEEIVGF
jgi:hypothetical protein